MFGFSKTPFCFFTMHATNYTVQPSDMLGESFSLDSTNCSFDCFEQNPPRFLPMQATNYTVQSSDMLDKPSPSISTNCNESCFEQVPPQHILHLQALKTPVPSGNKPGGSVLRPASSRSEPRKLNPRATSFSPVGFYDPAADLASLNPHAPAFTPRVQYKPGMNLEELRQQYVSLPPAMREHAFESSGVPKYLESKVERLGENRQARPRKSGTTYEPKRSVPAQDYAPVRLPSSQGEPKKPSISGGPEISSQYRRWAEWKIANLHTQIDSIKEPSEKKRAHISINNSAWLLMHARLTVKMMRTLLSDESITLLRYAPRKQGRRPTQFTLGHFMPDTRVIPILEGVSTLERWEQLRPAFQRNRPIWKAGVDYLKGELRKEDEERFLRQVASVIPRLRRLEEYQLPTIHYQSGLISKPSEPETSHPRPEPLGTVLTTSVVAEEEKVTLSCAPRFLDYVRKKITTTMCQSEDMIIQEMYRKELEKEVAKIRYQGNAVSGAAPSAEPTSFWHIKHHHQFPANLVSEINIMLLSFTELLENQLQPRFRSFGMRLMTLLASLAVSTTWLQYVTAFAQFLAGSDLLDFQANFLDCLMDYISRAFATRWRIAARQSGGLMTEDDLEEEMRIHFQNGAPDHGETLPDGFTTGFLAHLWSEIAGFFKEIPNSISSTISALIASTKFVLIRDVGKSIAEYIVECFVVARTRILQAIEHEDISLLFSQRTPPAVLIKHAIGLRTHFATLVSPDNKLVREAIGNLVVAGEIPSWVAPSTYDDWLKRADSLSVELGETLQALPNSANLRTPVILAKNELDRFISTIRSGRGARTRIQPAYIFVHGVPGCGKTFLVEHLIDALRKEHGDKWGLHEGGSAIGTFQPKANFQSDIKPEAWVIKFNDVDVGLKAPPSSDTLDPVTYITQLVDTCPFENESAIAENKGHNFIQPLLVVHTSNFKDASARDSLKLPEILYRRMTLRLEVRPRPEFASEPDDKGLSRLLTNKAKTAGTFDSIIVDVEKFVDGKWRVVAKDARVSQVFKIVSAYCDDWWQSEKKRVESGTVATHCPTCFLPNNATCSCSTGEVEAVFHGMIHRQMLDIPGAFNKVKDNILEFGARLVVRDYAREFKEAAKESARAMVSHAGKITLFLGLIIAMGTAVARSQARVNNATEISPGYIRADGVRPLPINRKNPSTWTAENMIRAVRRNFVNVTNGNALIRGVIVSTGVVLVPTHIGKEGDTLSIQRCNLPNERAVQTVLRKPNYFVLPDAELMLVRNSNLSATSDILQYFISDVDLSISSYDQGIIFGPEEEVYNTVDCKVVRIGTDLRLSTDCETKDGDCGMLYAVCHNSSWKIAGMHFALMESFSNARSLAAFVPSLVIRKAINDNMAYTTFQSAAVVSTFTPDGREPETLTFEQRSNVWNAITQGAELYSFGRLYPPIPGIRPKTRIQDSLLASEVYQHFPEVEPGDYGPPDFKTRKDEDGVWKNPIYHALMETNNVDFDENDIVCIYDYLSGFIGTDCEGYNVLSTEDAIRGIPGSCLHSVNLATSIGPPFMGPKDKFIDIHGAEVFLSPTLDAQIREIEGVLEEGYSPQIMATMTLKDEVLKKGKVARAFYNLPAAANIVAKRYLGPVRAFLQANPFLSECMVGIDMTNAQNINTLVKRLKMTGKHYYDMDAKSLDRTVNAASLLKVAFIFEQLARYLGTDDRKAFLCVTMMLSALVNVTGDLVNTQWNLSGHDSTVQVNSICMSLGERRIWYELHPEELMKVKGAALQWWARRHEEPLPLSFQPYRLYTTIVTYGDDMVIASSHERPANTAELWKKYLGYDVTDGSKSKDIRRKDFSELVFLKRTFKYLPEFNLYVGALDIKSIVRMLLFKKTKTLSHIDHMADMLTCAQKELVYHGREQYHRLDPIIVSFLEKYGPNAYLKTQDYDSAIDDVVAGNFRTWRVDDPEPLDHTPDSLGGSAE